MPVPCPVGMTIPSGSRSGNKNWVVLWLIFPICINTFSCSLTDIGMVLWSKRWLTKNRWIFVARPNKAICESREKKASLIFLLTPSDRARTSSITIVRWVNWWLGLSYKIACRFWMRVAHWLNCSLTCETKSDFERFSTGCITAAWFSLAHRLGVSKMCIRDSSWCRFVSLSVISILILSTSRTRFCWFSGWAAWLLRFLPMSSIGNCFFRC